jgi:hypothetical protein
LSPWPLWPHTKPLSRTKEVKWTEVSLYSSVNSIDLAQVVLLPVWRVVVAVSLFPAFGTLYQRLTLPESTRYNYARKVASDMEKHSSLAGSDDLEKEKGRDEKGGAVAINELALQSDQVDKTFKKDYWKGESCASSKDKTTHY